MFQVRTICAPRTAAVTEIKARTKTVIATGAKSNDTFNASYVCKEPETAAD